VFARDDLEHARRHHARRRRPVDFIDGARDAHPLRLIDRAKLDEAIEPDPEKRPGPLPSKRSSSSSCVPSTESRSVVVMALNNATHRAIELSESCGTIRDADRVGSYGGTGPR
jgi:hypothetical protein